MRAEAITRRESEKWSAMEARQKAELKVLRDASRDSKSKLMDALETASLICCITTLLLGIMLIASMLKLGDAPRSESLTTVISMLVIIMHACYIIAWFVYFVPAAREISGHIIQTWWPKRVPKPKEAIRRAFPHARLRSTHAIGRHPLPTRVPIVRIWVDNMGRRLIRRKVQS